MTASSLGHGMTSSMRARNFSRRVIFFLAANSAWAKLVWWVMPCSLENTLLAVCNKSKRSGLNQRFPRGSIAVECVGQIAWNGKAGDYRPYRFQNTIIFGEEEKGRYPNLRTYNLVLDVK